MAAFDRDSNLYVAASHGGHRGIVRITPQGTAETVLSGSGLVGLALFPMMVPLLVRSPAITRTAGSVVWSTYSTWQAITC